MSKISEEILFTGKWLRIKKSLFISRGQEFEWESIERVGHQCGIVIVARLMPSNRLVLLRQYRPALNNYVLGFPAGMGESDRIADEALRELREETGYEGTIIAVSPALKGNPALMSDSMYIVNVEIDETSPANQHPVQQLEPSEDIEVILMEEHSIPGFLVEQKQIGVEIGVGLWYAFALR